MRKLLILPIVLFLIVSTVQATDFTAPVVPESAQEYMPRESTSFGQDLWYIIKSAISKINPSISDASRICVSIIIVMILLSVLQDFKGITGTTVKLAGAICVCLILLLPSNAFLELGIETIETTGEYGKLLIPVMTAALAAEGGGVTATALYTATMVFNTILTTGITKVIIPLLYGYIVLCIATAVLGETHLGNLKSFFKWLITWILKATIYLFTGYVGITGVISGTTDAAALKATKMALSGVVPVVGSMISDASETILVGAGVVKNGVGVYGLLAVISILISPFVKIGVQYLFLKLTAGACGVFGCKNAVGLVKDFCGVLGFVLAAIGTMSLLMLVSIVCYLKGVH